MLWEWCQNRDDVKITRTINKSARKNTKFICVTQFFVIIDSFGGMFFASFPSPVHAYFVSVSAGKNLNIDLNCIMIYHETRNKVLLHSTIFVHFFFRNALLFLSHRLLPRINCLPETDTQIPKKSHGPRFYQHKSVYAQSHSNGKES